MHERERERYRREASSWPNHAYGRLVEAGGLCWHVQTAGSGPPLLLVHGTGASTHSWRDLLPLLARTYTVLAVDLPGHGFSGPLLGSRCTIGGMSEALAGLLRAVDFQPRYAVGHSAGAVILCRMALERAIEPRLILALNGAFLPLTGAAAVLFAPFARLLAGSPLMRALIARRAGERASVARIIAGTGSHLDAAGIDLYARLVREPAHLQGALAMMADWDLAAFARELPRLRTPLALLVADNDLTVPPRQALEVQRRVAQASIEHLAGLGHLAHEERPQRLAEVILRICAAP